MADEALFIGWGDVVRGRERKAVEVFNESIQYYGQLQQDAMIESFEAWFLAPHGGDLAGFILVRGERERLDEVQRSPEFELLQTRAGMIVDRVGVVSAYTGEALSRLMGQFEQAAAELGG
jgi:predicted GNAT superfamily acetyltransferase